MDSRSAAHVLSQIGAILLAKGEQRFKARAYAGAARALIALDTDDLGPLLRSGELADTPGIGPATLSVVRDLVETGESRYLNELSEGMPEGMLDLMEVPGLNAAKVQLIHETLGVQNLDDLERVAQNGQLAELPKFGKKTAEKILRGIEIVRRDAHLQRFPAAAIEAHMLLANVVKHPNVVRAEVAGSIRRHNELVSDIDIVAECSSDPAAVAESFARSPGVRDAKPAADPGSVHIRFVDGTHLDMICVNKAEYPVALWRATGSKSHVDDLSAFARGAGYTIEGNALIARSGKRISLKDEDALFTNLDLQVIPPELREGMGEIEAAARRQLPNLVVFEDLRGVLHCHSDYSDGSATIEEMANAAKERGWDYIGISDHSESAFYAGGLKRDKLQRQHEEIDELNSRMERFRILKGIEADILADGRLDYDARILDQFDYVIGSIHSRFSMDGDAMTKRVLAAMDDPHLTILAHPTGRLLLTREPYAIDIDAVLEKAARTGVSVELNADPHRLDLDWRYCRQAKELGVTIEIGPDAHSARSVDNVHFGIGLARKAWLEAGEILNTRGADDIIAFARKRGAK
ncbi:MAG TPA: DNA polymerase/3'-5' exonuclease PolX [Gemmatimonadaceae bacterium]|jgi:DNA polymerase (family 10)|nr:DNA polymerase/3'-5' exonuclease PolX [Gemmatimonadaceae bacterium]